LFVPTLIGIVWFSTFGMTGVSVGQSVPEIFEMPPETQLFGVFDELPMGLLLSLVAMLLVSSFFITSADSATFVLGMQTSFGSRSEERRVGKECTAGRADDEGRR